jgi:very-short-patch-repair endonuclease
VHDRNPFSRPSALGVVHTTRTFDERHVTTVDGLRVTVPMRCIVDLAGDLHPFRVERLIDNVVARGLGSYASLHRIIDELSGRGRAGSTLLRELAVARTPGGRGPESNLESRVNQLLLQAGHRPLEGQVDLGDDDWIGRVDLVDRELRIVVEVQSEQYHSSVLDRRRDGERRARLEAVGWHVIEVWDRDVWYRPRDVVEAVAGERARAVRQAA